MLLIAEGITGGGVLEADAGNDVTGRALLTVHPLVCVHLEDAPQALALALNRVVDIGACLGLTGIDADIGELTDEGVSHDLEREGTKGLLYVRMAQLGLALGVGAIDLWHVKWTRQVVNDRVEQLLDTLVLVG